MADEIVQVIVVNLDDEQVKEVFSNLEKSSEASSKKVGDNLEKNLGESIGKKIAESVKKLNEGLKQTTENAASLSQSLAGIAGSASAIAGTTVIFTSLAKNLESVSKLGGDVANVLFGARGLFGLTSTLAILSTGLLAFSSGLGQLENDLAKAASGISRFTALLLGGFAAALSFAILKLADLAQSLGTRFVKFFDDSAVSFAKASQNLGVFAKIVENFNKVTNGAIGSTAGWNKEIDNLSKSLNISDVALRKSAQEIIQVGSQLGFQRKELQKLLKISAEFAKINGKDVFQATLAVVNALQGNTVALQAYGVKLNESSIRQFAFKKGLDESFSTLSDSEKVQLRFNKLVESYGKVAGVAAVAANSLGDQSARLKINQDRLSRSLGRGAAIVEQNNLLAAIFNKILDNVNDTVIATAGFFGALGARFLQVGGLIAEITFKTFALVKGIKILNLVLSSDIGIRSFAAQLPLINKSLNELISNITKTEVRVTSLNTLISALGLATRKSFDNFLKFFTGVETKGFTVFGALRGLFGRIGVALGVLKSGFAAVLVPLAPIAAAIGLLVGTATALFKAFQIIEQNTGVFATTLGVLKQALEDTTTALSPLFNAITAFGNRVREIAVRVFGQFISGLTSIISTAAALVARNPFGVFSDETVKAFSGIEERLDSFNAKLRNADFDFREFGTSVERTVAGVNDSINKFDIEKLSTQLMELRDVGKTDLVLLEEELAERLEIIRLSKEAELIQEQEFQELTNAVLADAGERRKEIFEKQFNELNKFAIQASRQITNTLRNGLVRAVQTASALIGKSLVTGGLSFKTFAFTILGIIGDLLLQLSAAFIAIGLGIEAIKASVVGLSGGPALAAGLALAVLGAALKAFSSQGGAAGAETGGAVPGAGGFGGGDAFGVPVGTDLATQDEQQAQTQVQVNIQGDVLDSDETGTRIVELLNDAFDKEGVVVTGGTA